MTSQCPHGDPIGWLLHKIITKVNTDPILSYVRFNGSAGVQDPISSSSEQAKVEFEDKAVLALQVPTSPGILGKMFDLKPLSKYVEVA
jgi:hypothetical protein